MKKWSIGGKPEDGTGNVNVSIPRNGFGDYSFGKIVSEHNTTSVSVTTSVATIHTFSNITGLKAGSKVEIYCYIPVRNDNTSWGGFYFYPYVSFDGGSNWTSLGNSGYSSIMENGGGSIGYYNNTYLIDPQATSDWSIMIRFSGKSYNGTTTVIGRSNISSGNSSNATNNYQHYSHYILKEYIPN